VEHRGEGLIFSGASLACVAVLLGNQHMLKTCLEIAPAARFSDQRQ